MMTVQLKVDETQFKELLDKELKDMPKEVIQEAILSAIKEYFSIDDGKNLGFLIEESGYHYGEKRPSDFLKKTLAECDYSKLQNIIDKMSEELEKNHKFILQEVVLNALINGFTNTYSMQEVLRSQISDIMYKMRQQNNQ